MRPPLSTKVNNLPVNLTVGCLLVQPGRSANLGAQAQGTVPPGYHQGPGVAQKNLARKIGAQTAVLQAPDGDTAGKKRAFPPARLTQLVGTTATVALSIGIARAAVLTAYGSELSPMTIQISHAGRLSFSSSRSAHLKSAGTHHVILASIIITDLAAGNKSAQPFARVGG